MLLLVVFSYKLSFLFETGVSNVKNLSTVMLQIRSVREEKAVVLFTWLIIIRIKGVRGIKEYKKKKKKKFYCLNVFLLVGFHLVF